MTSTTCRRRAPLPDDLGHRRHRHDPLYRRPRAPRIDLTAATLDYSATGGGAISFVDDIHGGYTIANGVVIENATSGSGADVLIGNAAVNVLTGNDGDDWLMGKAGRRHAQWRRGLRHRQLHQRAAGVTASLAKQPRSAATRRATIRLDRESSKAASCTTR
jgi:Ca2+-binding RTX toxin-like protein